jgi:hypothetical protein
VRESGRLRYAQGAPDLHALFGWLQVAQVVRVAAVRPGDLLWARGHPHFWGERGAGNTLYLAADHLSAGGTSAGARRLPGAGIFRRFEPCVCLTAQPGSVPRSVWKLPEWMHRPRQSPLLSHHGDARRWQPAGEAWLLRTVPRGQEFVIDLDRIHSPERAIAWLRELIGRAFRSS